MFYEIKLEIINTMQINFLDLQKNDIMEQDKSQLQTIEKKEKSIKIIKDYPDFHEFYLENKPNIYDTIIEIFAQFIDNDIKTFSLKIDAKIKGIDWKTDFVFSIDKDLELLISDIMPFYIEKEEYEKCADIKKLYLQLKNHKYNTKIK